MEAAVDGDDLSGRLAEAVGDEKEVGFRLVGWGDRIFGQGTISVKAGKLRGQRIGRLIFGVRDVVFRQRGDHAVAGEHR